MATVPNSTSPAPAPHLADTLTVIGISAIAYIVAVFLHEVMGHGAACVVLGGRLAEVGAFYVDCNYGAMSDAANRAVALAGPAMSVVVGLVSWLAWRRVPKTSAHGRYFAWLLGTVALLQATGYLLFSGVSGLGDFGGSRDGALYQLSPQWAWQGGITVLGALGYGLVIFASLRLMNAMIGGEGAERVRRASRLALTSYLTGAVVSILIGLLNPHGVLIVLESAAASSVGGTSALFWMMQMLNRKPALREPPLALNRRWGWIAAGVVVTVLYTLILGPTLRP